MYYIILSILLSRCIFIIPYSHVTFKIDYMIIVYIFSLFMVFYCYWYYVGAFFWKFDLLMLLLRYKNYVTRNCVAKTDVKNAKTGWFFCLSELYQHNRFKLLRIDYSDEINICWT